MGGRLIPPPILFPIAVEDAINIYQIHAAFREGINLSAIRGFPERVSGEAAHPVPERHHQPVALGRSALVNPHRRNIPWGIMFPVIAELAAGAYDKIITSAPRLRISSVFSPSL